MLSGRHEEACRQLEAAIEHGGHFGAAYYALGLSYRERGLSEQAEKYLALFSQYRLASPPRVHPLGAELRKLDISDAPFFRAGSSALARGDLADARNAFERAIELNPKNVGAYASLVGVYALLGEPDKAEQSYANAILIDPDRPKAHFNLGLLRHQQGRLTEAVAALSKAAELEPEDPDNHTRLGLALDASGNKTWIAATAAAICAASSAQALVVTQNSDANALASTILGAGITIDSASVVGAAPAFGTFTDGNASGLGINSGIIISTGNVLDAPGPNSSDSITTANGVGGYAPLDAATGTTTQDAAALVLEFTSAGGDIFFNYIFASDEYNEFANTSFNDSFALLLDGVNIALLSDGMTPVTINNVNGTDTPTLFNNNDFGDLGSPTPFDIEYDGFTTVFQAAFTGLAPGMHTLALAIGDVGDASFDSAVFIEAGSLTDTNPMPEPGTLALFGLGIIAVGLRRRT